ncbi:hypothetical protein B5S28_g1203 [[Candida] boidinii]|nr:hypothetical protein B5S28_g1203 [[Candida] boidinii]OWB59793.1 hypothetical protein B5S29_g657 [[Candida] boidinii]OWB71471.1 hypothetical protein B5S31_g1160 [[Candida] boidinii]
MARNFKPKTKTKKKSQRRALDAFQIAERQEQRKGRGGDDSDDGSDDEFSVKNGTLDARRHLGEKYDPDEEFEDEELDSDEALGSDDDYDILNSKFSQTLRDKKKNKKNANKKNSKRNNYESESESEEEGYSSIDESELIPLSEVWARDDEDLKKTLSQKTSTPSQTKPKSNDIILDDSISSESEEESNSELSDDEDDEDNSDSEGSDFSDNEEEDEDGMKELDEDPFDELDDDDEDDEDEESGLKNVMSKLTSKQKEKQQREKKILINDKTDENEFNLPTGGKKLSLMDMMAGMDEDVNEDAILIDKEDDIADESTKTLAVPLPQRIQQRNERKAAYDIQKEEVEQWNDTVQQNRRAEVLKFTDSKEGKPNEASSFKPVEKPITELEKKVEDILKESTMESKKTESLFEEIETAKMTKEELAQRRNELRLMRELMFRGQRDSKRLKKIKSKTYRQKLRKERLRNQELVEGSDMEDEDPEEADAKRAQERMSLKHKNNSQWARSMIKSGMMNDKENRDQMEESLRQGEKLRMKQLGRDDDDSGDDRNVSDIEKNYGSDSEDDSISRQKLGKGVMAMDFMKNADKREREQNLRDLNELKDYSLNSSELDKELFNESSTTSANINKNGGRRVYTPSAAIVSNETREADEKVLDEIKYDETKSLTNRLSKDSGKTNKANKKRKSDDSDEDETENAAASNPWLDGFNDNSEGQRSTKLTVIDKNSNRLDKSAAKISKHANEKGKKRSKKDNNKDIEDNVVLDVNSVLNVRNNNDSDEGEEFEQEGGKSSDIKMFLQKDLIKEAFAGDNVFTEFRSEKKEVEEDEGDKEIDLTLPGWGSWAGGKDKGFKKKKIIKTVNGVVQKDKRLDKGKKNVIINEKVNKKNVKYQANGVPYPFETMEQYERSLRMPLGQEWNSRSTHQKLTMPRIVAKHGSVIDPLKAPFK